MAARTRHLGLHSKHSSVLYENDQALVRAPAKRAKKGPGGRRRSPERCCSTQRCSVTRTPSTGGSRKSARVGGPGTGVFTVSTFELLVEASARVADFSSNMKCLLYRDDAGSPWPVHVRGRRRSGAGHRRSAVARDPSPGRLSRTGDQAHGGARSGDPRARRRARDPCLAKRDDRVHERHWQRRADHDDQPAHRVSRQQPRRALALGSAHDQVGRVDTDARRARDVASGGDEVQAWIADQVAAAVKEPSEDLLGAVARSVVEGSSLRPRQPAS